MMPLKLNPSTGNLRVLCLGAHSDDIEIGCGGTILRLAEEYPDCQFHWAVFSAAGVRGSEAARAAQLFAGAHLRDTLLKQFRDGFLPWQAAEVKTVFEEELKPLCPDLILTHYGNDAHQDHRLISQLTWNTFRNHCILEYEIPKYDGDLGRPAVFFPLGQHHSEAKVQRLMDAFSSQHAKHWFKPETFLALMRLRGLECVAPAGYAEAFYSRKLVL